MVAVPEVALETTRMVFELVIWLYAIRLVLANDVGRILLCQAADFFAGAVGVRV